MWQDLSTFGDVEYSMLDAGFLSQRSDNAAAAAAAARTSRTPRVKRGFDVDNLPSEVPDALAEWKWEQKKSPKPARKRSPKQKNAAGATLSLPKVPKRKKPEHWIVSESDIGLFSELELSPPETRAVPLHVKKPSRTAKKPENWIVSESDIGFFSELGLSPPETRAVPLHVKKPSRTAKKPSQPPTPADIGASWDGAAFLSDFHEEDGPASGFRNSPVPDLEIGSILPHQEGILLSPQERKGSLRTGQPRSSSQKGRHTVRFTAPQEENFSDDWFWNATEQPFSGSPLHSETTISTTLLSKGERRKGWGSTRRSSLKSVRTQYVLFSGNKERSLHATETVETPKSHSKLARLRAFLATERSPQAPREEARGNLSALRTTTTTTAVEDAGSVTVPDKEEAAPPARTRQSAPPSPLPPAQPEAERPVHEARPQPTSYSPRGVKMASAFPSRPAQAVPLPAAAPTNASDYALPRAAVGADAAGELPRQPVVCGARKKMSAPRRVSPLDETAFQPMTTMTSPSVPRAPANLYHHQHQQSNNLPTGVQSTAIPSPPLRIHNKSGGAVVPKNGSRSTSVSAAAVPTTRVHSTSTGGARPMVPPPTRSLVPGGAPTARPTRLHVLHPPELDDTELSIPLMRDDAVTGSGRLTPDTLRSIEFRRSQRLANGSLKGDDDSVRV